MCYIYTNKQTKIITKKTNKMNMSYCRFENTSKDLSDCLEAIENGKHTDLNRYEKEGLQNILYLCEAILERQDEIEEVLNSNE